MESRSSVDSTTLNLDRRMEARGPVKVDFSVVGGKATGKMSTTGRTPGVPAAAQPFEAALPGPLFADGPGRWHLLATLPLKTGYKAKFYNFDTATKKPKTMQVEVTGQETVTVPAGTFEAWKAEVTAIDGGSEKTAVWVDIVKRRYVKSTGTSPRMPGAIETAELMQ